MVGDGCSPREYALHVSTLIHSILLAVGYDSILSNQKRCVRIDETPARCGKKHLAWSHEYRINLKQNVDVYNKVDSILLSDQSLHIPIYEFLTIIN